MEQIDIKNRARSLYVVELVSLMVKEEEEEGENAILAFPGSICGRQFASVTAVVLDVKSLIEHGDEG